MAVGSLCRGEHKPTNRVSVGQATLTGLVGSIPTVTAHRARGTGHKRTEHSYDHVLICKWRGWGWGLHNDQTQGRERSRPLCYSGGMISEISLDTHWRCEYVEQVPDGQIDGFDIASLVKFEPRQIQTKMAWLERYFDLPMQDICINYTLHIDRAPVGTHLTLNGRDLGEIVAPLELDVTDLVALEDNVMTLRVARNAFGRFGAVRLTVIPCE